MFGGQAKINLTKVGNSSSRQCLWQQVMAHWCLKSATALTMACNRKCFCSSVLGIKKARRKMWGLERAVPR